MTRRYATREEAIQRQIIEPIEARADGVEGHDDFDIEAIADKVLGDYTTGFAQIVDVDEFWAAVRSCDKDITEQQQAAQCVAERAVLQTSDDGADLEVRCTACREHLCDAQDGDTLAVLLRAVADHTCH